ncbi:MAG: thiamine pyrophosphate-dependent enzyme [Candidatus Omnitrophota bacterium]
MIDTPTEFHISHVTDVPWCPGCGSHMLQKAVNLALHELKIEQENLLMVSEIDQAIKLSDTKLVVIVESGERNMLGEGGHHFLRAIRRNTDVTMIVHNNMAYGLTNAQASPASQHGRKTPAKLEPFNPLGVALSRNAPFIARAFAGDIEQTKLMIMEAITFKGFSVVDVCQPCVLFNKLSAYHWFKKNISYLPKGHNTTDRNAAFRLATGYDKLPLGVFFRHNGSALYEEPLGIDTTPLFQQQHDERNCKMMIEACR